MPRDRRVDVHQGVPGAREPRAEVVVLVEQEDLRVEPARLQHPLPAGEQAGAGEEGRAAIALDHPFALRLVAQIRREQGAHGEEVPPVGLDRRGARSAASG